MAEMLRLVYVSGDITRSAELLREPIKLDEDTWDWLKGAFLATGWLPEQVEAFFNNDPGVVE